MGAHQQEKESDQKEESWKKETQPEELATEMKVAQTLLRKSDTVSTKVRCHCQFIHCP